VSHTISGVHFLITYACSSQCDHCFVWGAPGRGPGMGVADVDRFLDQLAATGSVRSVCAEGGEAFLHYEVVLHFTRRATRLGLAPSALTNASWVTSRGLAEERVAELLAAGLTSLGVSTDQWHRRYIPLAKVETLLEVCAAAGLQASRMETSLEGVMFRGRAAHRLARDRPLRPASELTTCPHEQLTAPSRVHLDRYGRLHLCQGLNLTDAPRAEALVSYDPAAHPIVRHLADGGPHALARFAADLGFQPAPGYADACHLCYCVRRFLRSRFPALLGPDEMYGA